MSGRATFQASYADLKLIKTRKVAQLIFEVPIEQAEHVISALGIPMPDREQWVAVAALVGKRDEQSITDRPVASGGEAGSAAGVEGPGLHLKERQRWSDLSPAQQAGIRCADERFQEWLANSYTGAWNRLVIESSKPFTTVDRATDTVRRICGVTSRSELNANLEARRKWQQLDTAYLMAIGQMASEHGQATAAG